MEIFKRKSWVNTVNYGSVLCHGPAGGLTVPPPDSQLLFVLCTCFMPIIWAPSAFFFLYYPLTSWISTKGGLTYKRGVWHPLPTMGNKDLVGGVYWGTFPGGGGMRIFAQWRSDSPHFPSRGNHVVLHDSPSKKSVKDFNIPWPPIFLGGEDSMNFYMFLYVKDIFHKCVGIENNQP